MRRPDLATAEQQRRRLRCCGRFCYWAIPYGPWRCTRCYRGLPGAMPANAGGRLLEAAADQVARARPWTETERQFVRACFGPLATTFPT